MADQDFGQGHSYLSAEIVAYLDRVHYRHNPAADAAFRAPEANDIPVIQVAASEGALLQMLVAATGSKRIVELGTLTGYSALMLAGGMPAGGRLFTIEFDEKHAAVANACFSASDERERISLRRGSALEVLPTLESEGPFDIVFIDADKENYANYARWALANLRPGGLVIADNALFFGRLLDDSAGAKAMRETHELVAKACRSVCITTPDGMLVGQLPASDN